MPLLVFVIVAIAWLDNIAHPDTPFPARYGHDIPETFEQHVDGIRK